MTEQQQMVQIGKYAAVYGDGDLYKALHHVGDDGTKADIEECLRMLLPEDTMRLVAGVFMFAVDEDVKW